MSSRVFARRAIALVLAAACLTVCSNDEPKYLAGVVREPALEVGAAQLPDVTESDVGVPFHFAAAPGELLVVYFGYTNCPDLCPTTMADLRAAKRRIGAEADKIDLAFATVDPDRDTPEVLRAYIGSFSDRFHVLRTTDPAALQAAEEPFLVTSSVTKASDGTVEVTHNATTFVIDDTGTVLVEWPFGLGPSGMENDLRILLDQIEHRPSSSSIEVTDAWARETPAGTSVGAVYMGLTADHDDALVGVRVAPSIAGSTELHETMTDASGGAMTMQPLARLALPKGQTVTLEPGGYHVMLVDLAAPLVAGENFLVTLEFESGASQNVAVTVPHALVMVVLAAGLLATSCGDDTSGGDEWPDVPVQQLDGTTVGSGEIVHGGRPAIVSIWATTCVPCKDELPRLQSLGEDEPGVDVAGVNLGDATSAIEFYTADLGLTMPMWVDGESRLSEALGVVGLPATIFVDGNGRIVERHLGELSAAQLQAGAAKLLSAG